MCVRPAACKLCRCATPAEPRTAKAPYLPLSSPGTVSSLMLQSGNDGMAVSMATNMQQNLCYIVRWCGSCLDIMLSNIMLLRLGGFAYGWLVSQVAQRVYSVTTPRMVSESHPCPFRCLSKSRKSRLLRLQVPEVPNVQLIDRGVSPGGGCRGPVLLPPCRHAAAAVQPHDLHQHSIQFPV